MISRFHLGQFGPVDLAHFIRFARFCNVMASSVFLAVLALASSELGL
jgi:hypothetical protein